jgi:hypothetical protein|tara:strand:- start:313 stop:696 length:384 start_codon:yes stop_codon:yes gene_type:complete
MATTSRTKDAVAFDVSKYTIKVEPVTQTVTIEETGDTFEVSVRNISWAKRNQLISRFMNWDADGNTKFNASEYVRACLCEMIVKAPWGKTTEAFLISIDSRLGKALETIVPEAFETEATDVEIVKNE